MTQAILPHLPTLNLPACSTHARTVCPLSRRTQRSFPCSYERPTLHLCSGSLFPHLLKDFASAVISFLLCLPCPLRIYSHQHIDTLTSGSPMSMGSPSQPPLPAPPSLPILPTESVQCFASSPFIFLTNLIQPHSLKYHQYVLKMPIFALLTSISLQLHTCILLWT